MAMLYKYDLIKDHKLLKLNRQLLFFIRRIRHVRSKAKFIPKHYFHNSFLNANGKIAPNKRTNILLQEKFKLFFDTYKQLPKNKQDDFYQVILFATRIPFYFEDENVDVKSLRKENLLSIIGNDSFQNLMNALWDSLSSNAWEIDNHYKLFFEKLSNNAKICPFCGINKLPNPEHYRPDYDHLAYKSSYPISAINLKNIAPSCVECNQKFKGSKDVFYEVDDVTRRPFNYPYSNFVNVEIDFTGTILPNTSLANLQGSWQIEFIPKNRITKTWNEVYEIKRRYVTEVLEVEYNTWYSLFKDELKDYNVVINDYNDLKKQFVRHFERYAKHKFQKSYFLRSALFKYLYDCNDHIFYDMLVKELN